jgi:hypothetical protein
MAFMDDMRESIKHAKRQDPGDSQIPGGPSGPDAEGFDATGNVNMFKNKITAGQAVISLCIAAGVFFAFQEFKKVIFTPGPQPSTVYAAPTNSPVQTEQTNMPQQQTTPQNALSNDKVGDWYVIENDMGKCKPDKGPASLIKSLKSLGQPYQVREDVVEGNRPMQVRLLLNDGYEAGEIIYYRGKARCQTAADKKKQTTDSELNRYK